VDSSVDFRGPGPFELPVAQRAIARRLDETVLVTLFAVVGDDPNPRPIRIQMVPRVANELAQNIIEATLSVHVASKVQ
jgi:hypothetical protein